MPDHKGNGSVATAQTRFVSPTTRVLASIVYLYSDTPDQVFVTLEDTACSKMIDSSEDLCRATCNTSLIGGQRASLPA